MAEMIGIIMIGLCLLTSFFLWAMVVSSKQADGKIREMMMGKETKNGIHEKD